MNAIHSPSCQASRLLLMFSLIGAALPASAALVPYDSFSYGPTTDSQFWKEYRGQTGSVEFNGAAILRQPGTVPSGLAAIQAPALTQQFLNMGDTFRLTFDLTIIDFGAGESTSGFGLINGKLGVDLMAGLRVSQGRVYLSDRFKGISLFNTTAVHLDWEVKDVSPNNLLFDSTITAYAINPSWSSTPESYRTQSKPITTLSSRSNAAYNIMLLGAFCGTPQLSPTTSTLDQGAVAFDNVYYESAPEPSTAALAVIGSLAILARRRPARKRFEG